ncbi:MAG: RNA polymerase sigma factor [Acidobacteria bacterium]|nr:RNA polymerase sigma factor [Acidobacteriota bacterium]
MDLAAEWTEREQGERPAATEDEVASEQEFAALVERHSRTMFRVARGLLGNAHDAEDAVQEAFLKLYRTGGWVRMENERAFLAKTVWRVALDRLKATGSVPDVSELDVAEKRESPEALAAGGDERELLRQMIDALPEDLRRPLVLSAIEEMTSVEVAAVMGIPEGTVRTRVMRAKAELKKRFEAMKGVRR